MHQTPAEHVFPGLISLNSSSGKMVPFSQNSSSEKMSSGKIRHFFPDVQF